MASVNEEILKLTTGLEDAAAMVMATEPGSPARAQAEQIYDVGSREARETLEALDPDWKDPLRVRLFAEGLARRIRESRR